MRNLFLLVLIILPAVILTKRMSYGSIRKCPDEWIVNRMPMIANGMLDTVRMKIEKFMNPHLGQYFIVGGQRAEIKDYDFPWVEKNCPVKSVVVQ